MTSADRIKAAGASSVKLPYEEFLIFPDDGKWHEMIDGEHYKTPLPNTKHQRIVTKVTLALGRFLEQSRLDEVFVAPFDTVFADLDVVEPDQDLSSRGRRVRPVARIKCRTQGCNDLATPAWIWGEASRPVRLADLTRSDETSACGSRRPVLLLNRRTIPCACERC